MAAAPRRYLVMAIRQPGFDAGVIEPHLAYIGQLRARGQLELSGGFSDSSGGAYVLRAADLAEARALADADPLHLTGASRLTVFEWNA
ncbi:YciI family protein [Marilutibacter spongiae]|uniref:YCII-related domain-containing protein n=1 Tax=Marilutibacter spongiae TaxID=2025720 RepID=A0A7W3TNV3_9GAMM|nr:YciI family protein [Lysobacter spongiae]MBB1061781.1 hypothetical protein [Lysobacter spongiae]